MTQEQWERFKQQAREQARLATFEGAVEELEALCHRYAPEPEERPEKGTDAWHAHRILWALRSARDLLARGQAAHAAAEALSIGLLAARWPQARAWRRQQEQRSQAGQAPKYLPAIQEAVDRLVALDPEATVAELWERIPEDEIEAVYREDGRIHIWHEDGRESSIARRTLESYVTRARRSLRTR